LAVNKKGYAAAVFAFEKAIGISINMYKYLMK